MAIKGKGKTKSKQVSRAPRREPVPVKKPFAQRGWVRGLVLFMCGVLVLSVTWWAYENIDQQRNASKAAATQGQQREAVSVWKVNLEGTLSSVQTFSRTRFSWISGCRQPMAYLWRPGLPCCRGRRF